MESCISHVVTEQLWSNETTINAEKVIQIIQNGNWSAFVIRRQILFKFISHLCTHKLVCLQYFERISYRFLFDFGRNKDRRDRAFRSYHFQSERQPYYLIANNNVFFCVPFLRNRFSFSSFTSVFSMRNQFVSGLYFDGKYFMTNMFRVARSLAIYYERCVAYAVFYK